MTIDGEVRALRPAILRREQAAARAASPRSAGSNAARSARINHLIERERLNQRRAILRQAKTAAPRLPALASARIAELQAEFEVLQARVNEIRAVDRASASSWKKSAGARIDPELSQIVRFFPANDLGLADKVGIYLSRWWEFVSTEPREANTQGGVLPAIFGTVAMTLLMVVFVAPFGVITALYLREYAKQGRLTSIVRISVNNLAGVPSIVYGVFGWAFSPIRWAAPSTSCSMPRTCPTRPSARAASCGRR
jgi:phosphate transport system permease protein